MPNSKSAKKRVRQNITRRTANRQKRASVRTLEKKVRSLAGEKKWGDAATVLGQFSSSIDKAAKTNIYHSNTAARKKSRLAKLVGQGAKSE